MVQNNQLSGLLAKIAVQEGIIDFFIVLHGSFNQEVVSSSIKLIEERCRLLNFSTSLVTKLKMVSVEILQNISKHQHVSDEVLPYFVIGSNHEGVSIYSGNMVNLKEKNLIHDRLHVYKNIDSQSLKDFYRQSLKQTSISEEGNAGIGLLDIVYRSNQQIEYNFHDYKENQYYFGLNVNISNKH